MLERRGAKRGRGFYLFIFAVLAFLRLLFLPEVNLPEHLSVQLQANETASISLMAAVLMLFIPLVEAVLVRLKPIWWGMAAFVFWAFALLYVFEHYVFTTFFLIGLVIIDGRLGVRRSGQAGWRTYRFYPVYVAVLLANAFWLQNTWLMAAVFLTGIGEAFLSHRRKAKG